VSMTTNPFAVLGLPERPDLDDETVRAAWRPIAAATHPDRPALLMLDSLFR
jgi:curved DNA-binding protein CbpA